MRWHGWGCFGLQVQKMKMLVQIDVPETDCNQPKNHLEKLVKVDFLFHMG